MDYNKKMFVTAETTNPLDTCLSKIGTRLIRSVDLLSLVMVQIWILLTQMWTPTRTSPGNQSCSCSPERNISPGTERNIPCESERHFPPPVPDKVIGNQIQGLFKCFEVFKRKLGSMHDDFENVMEKKESIELFFVKDALASVEEIQKRTLDLELEAWKKIVQFENEASKKVNEKALEKLVKDVEMKAKHIKSKCFKSLAQISSSSSNQKKLPRLPLPKFTGKSLDYFHFKETFIKQAKYDSQGCTRTFLEHS